jgi:hypothetical protein
MYTNETIQKNTAQTIQNTVNTSTNITKTNKHYKPHTYTHPHVRKQLQQPQYKLQQPQIQQLYDMELYVMCVMVW